ncbi:MAG: hypothetical protein V3S14_16170 [Anaerolineae bacterium]
MLEPDEANPEAQAARAEMLAHPQVQAMIADTATWGDRPIKRHNDAGHPIYKFSTLADLGVRADDASIPANIETVMAHQSPEGAFQSRVNVSKSFGGTGEDTWSALKALSLAPELLDSPATRTGTEMLLWHWEHQTERKIFMFGIGTDFRKLKYPFVWYNVLHVADVLSRFPFVHADPRFQEMVETITSQAGEKGRYTATSMYRAWKDWSFADKKHSSPWLTFRVL